MGEGDDIKKQFLDRLKANDEASRAADAKLFGEAEEAFSGLLVAARAMSEATQELGDTQLSVKYHQINKDRDGFYFIKLFFNNGPNSNQVTIRYGSSASGEACYWVRGLDNKYKDRLVAQAQGFRAQVMRDISGEFSVDRERESDLIDIVQEFGLEALKR